jgi:hypothetical protein
VNAPDQRRQQISQEKLQIGHRRQQHEHDVAGDLGLDQRRRRVGEGVLQHRHHDQTRHQECGVGHAGINLHMVFQHMREDQQIEQCGQHRRADGLHQYFPEAQNFLV